MGTMDGRTVVITGGNAGIGKETAVALARDGARVIFTSRDRSRGPAALAEITERSGGTVEVMPLDLASLASVRTFAAAVLAATDRIDALVNNAGLVLTDRRVTEDGFEMTFGVNHLGHFLLTDLLRERLIASAPARVVVLASFAHRFAWRGLDFDDLMSERRYSGFDVYARSKLANILFTLELSQRLTGTRVTARPISRAAARSTMLKPAQRSAMWRTPSEASVVRQARSTRSLTNTQTVCAPVADGAVAVLRRNSWKHHVSCPVPTARWK